MIPLGDVIPSRTRPVVTLALAAAGAGLLAPPALRPWAVLWIVNAMVVWTFGPTLEDQMGHGRFALFASMGAAVGSAVSAAVAPVSLVLAAWGGLGAAIAAAYLACYPRSRVISMVPVLVGIEIIEIPAWFVAAAWGVVHLGSALAAGSGQARIALLAAWFAAACTGGLAVRLFRRRERLQVDWWGP